MTEVIPALVGRDAALRALRTAVGGVQGLGSGSLVVSGPAGCGRTALISAFVREQSVSGTGTGLVHGSAVGWETERPGALLEHLLPSLGSVSWDVPLQVLELVTGALQQVRENAEDPLVVLVDDAHLADDTSLHVLTSIVRHRPQLRLLLVLSARADAAGRPELPPGVGGDLLVVEPLGVVEVGAVGASRGVFLTPSAAHALAAHTGGVARHVVSLLAEVPRETWAGTVDLLPAPADVAQVVVGLLMACNPPTRAVVAAAAVLRGSAPVWVVADVAGVSDVVAAVDEAEHRGLLRVRDRAGDRVVDLPNQMWRAAVVDQLGFQERTSLHRRAADHVQDQVEAVRHAAAALPGPDADLSERVCTLAAERGGRGEWSAAADLFLLSSRVSVDRRLREQRLLHAVDALVAAGDVPAAAGYVAEVESFPESPLRSAVLGYLAILRGRTQEAEALLVRAWQLVNRAREPEVAAMICHRRVLHHLSRCEGGELVDWADRAVELVGPMAPTAVEAQAIRGLGLGSTGRTDEALENYQDLSEHVASGAVAQRIQMGAGWLHLATDDIDLARAELKSAVPRDHLGGSSRISLWASGWLARTRFVTGDWDAALRTVSEAAQLAKESGMALVEPLLHWTGAQVHALRGEWDLAADDLRLGSAGVRDYEIMQVPSCLARAAVAEARADYAGVLRALEPVARQWGSRDIAEPGFWPWPDVYANALVLEGRLDDAEQFLAPHERRAEARGHRSARARLGYARGRLLGARGDLPAARAAFERSLELLEQLPLAYDRARVNFSFGQTLRRAGRRLEADAVIAAARDGYAALGATTYVERCERELRAGGVRATLRGRAADALTPQEDTVAGLVAAGLSNREAAAELFLSVKTVQFHLTRIYAKLGIRSRSELAATYLADGAAR